MRVAFPLRRSRGHVPAALPLTDHAPPLVAAGAELKSTFCVARGSEAFLSAHLGDLDSETAYRAFCADLELYLGDARGRAQGGRARPPSGVPRDEVGARAGRTARRRAAPPRPRGGVPGRARRGRAGARTRVRRHRLRHRRHAVGRRAAALRPHRVRAPRPPRARAAAGGRGGDSRALAGGGRAPRTGGAAGSVAGVGARA